MGDIYWSGPRKIIKRPMHICAPTAWVHCNAEAASALKSMACGRPNAFGWGLHWRWSRRGDCAQHRWWKLLGMALQYVVANNVLNDESDLGVEGQEPACPWAELEIV